MENETPGDGEPADHKDEVGLDSLLEALLVDDADVLWDPVTGRPHVARRRKPDLDRPHGRA